MKKTVTLFVIIIACLLFGAKAEIRKSQVPFADPYVLHDGYYYYAYGTNNNDGIDVWKSKDMIGWDYVGLALHKDNCTEKQWFWAPEVYHKNGRYYMFYTANEHLFVATSDSPTGPFYQQGGYQMQNILGDQKCIDSHVFFDDDGSAWLFFVRYDNGNHIWSCKLENDLITPIASTLKYCMSATEPWELIVPNVVEGPNVVKHNGIYYLTYSANGYTSHDYAVGYATSNSIGSGSWTKYSGNPILKNVEDLVGCGHHTLFYDKNGKLKIAYHAHNSTTNIHPRLLYFGDMYFDGDVLKFDYNSPSLRPLCSTEALSGMTERWNVSEQRGNATSKGYDATKIRNLCYSNGKLFCVYNNSKIIVLNAVNGEYLGELKEGDICTGGTYKFCDVKCFDGHIVACNLALAGQELRVYCWDSVTSEPRLLMSTTDLNGCARLGDCLEIADYSNWDNNLVLCFANDNGTATRMIEYTYNGSQWSPNVLTPTIDGSTLFRAVGTVRTYPSGGGWWVDGYASVPTYFNVSDGVLKRKCDIADVGTWGSIHREFYFHGFKYAVNLKFDDRLHGRARIEMDDVGDFSHVTWLGEYPAEGLGSATKNANGTGDVIVDTDGSSYVRIFVCCTEQGLACYAQGNVPQIAPGPMPSPEPDLYFCGANFDNWKHLPDYRMSCENGVYTLHVPYISGEFKIINDDCSEEWSYPQGSDHSKTMSLGTDYFVSNNVGAGDNNGNNCQLSVPAINCTVTYDRLNSIVNITGLSAPGIYLADAIYTGWAPNSEDYKFSHLANGLFELHLDRLPAGDEFKITTGSWSTDGGAEFSANRKDMDLGVVYDCPLNTTAHENMASPVDLDDVFIVFNADGYEVLLSSTSKSSVNVTERVSEAKVTCIYNILGMPVGRSLADIEGKSGIFIVVTDKGRYKLMK